MVRNKTINTKYPGLKTVHIILVYYHQKNAKVNNINYSDMIKGKDILVIRILLFNDAFQLLLLFFYSLLSFDTHTLLVYDYYIFNIYRRAFHKKKTIKVTTIKKNTQIRKYI